MALPGVQCARLEQTPVSMESFSSLPFPQVAWRKLPCTRTGSTCGAWWAASPTSRCQLTTTSRWWRMLLMGRTSTHVGPSDRRGIVVLRMHHVLVCVAKHMAGLCLPSGKVTEPKGHPFTPPKKEHFSSCFSADQTKLSILCRNHPLYPLSV